MFSIDFPKNTLSKECYIDGYTPKEASIQIGSFIEHVDLQLGYWRFDDYKSQWKEAVEMVLSRDGNRSILITQFLNPLKRKLGYAIEGWPMYREGDSVYIRNSYYTAGSVPQPWSLIDFIRNNIESRNPNDDVSEWKISIKELEAFYRAIG